MFKFILIFLTLFLFSCEESENKDTKDLCKDVFCGESYKCNDQTGECERIEGYCTNDTMCPENQFCNKEKKLCEVKGEKTTCEKHQDCKIWQFCDFETQKCVPRNGMCEKDEDCTEPPFLKCNTNVHKCMNTESCLYNFCESWEICREDEKCHLRDGFCNSDSDCIDQFPYDKCDLSEHKCKRPVINCTSYTQCDQNYQYCDENEGICKALQGKCRSSLDCIENSQNGNRTICKQDTYDCIVPESQNCKFTGCNYWQICNETLGICELPEGRCDNDSNCSGAREICNEAHYCEVDDCTTKGCNWWKYCDRDTGECILYDGMCDNNNDCIDYAPYNTCSLIHTCSKR